MGERCTTEKNTYNIETGIVVGSMPSLILCVNQCVNYLYPSRAIVPREVIAVPDHLCRNSTCSSIRLPIEVDANQVLPDLPSVSLYSSPRPILSGPSGGSGAVSAEMRQVRGWKKQEGSSYDMYEFYFSMSTSSVRYQRPEVSRPLVSVLYNCT